VSSLTALPNEVCIKEMCPRDGLQTEKSGFIPTSDKIKLCDMISEAGFRYVEVTSFSHPKWIPQLADSGEVYRGIHKNKDTVYAVLVPNVKAAERAMEAGAQEISAIVSSSESHCKSNLNTTIAEGLKKVEQITKIGTSGGAKVRAYISTSFGCPFEGLVDPKQVLDIALQMESFGIYEVSLGDTTGMANPVSAYKVPRLLLDNLKKASVAVHYHQCGGIEFANILSSLYAGVTVFDSAVGGLGGCPYAPDSFGNVPTEYLIKMFEDMNIKTNLDFESAKKCAAFAWQLVREVRKNKECVI
jgi:hydroxymethylglutaryl-CoA lyase